MAKPETGPDGSVNLMVWQCSIPGKPSVSFFCHIVSFENPESSCIVWNVLCYVVVLKELCHCSCICCWDDE